MKQPSMTSRDLMVCWLAEYLEGTNPSADEVLTNIEQSSWLAERDTKTLTDFRAERDRMGLLILALDKSGGEAFDAMAETIRLAGADGAEVALDWLADWMNAQDVVQPGDEKDYMAWTTRVAMDKADREMLLRTLDVSDAVADKFRKQRQAALDIYWAHYRAFAPDDCQCVGCQMGRELLTEPK